MLLKLFGIAAYVEQDSIINNVDSIVEIIDVDNKENGPQDRVLWYAMFL